MDTICFLYAELFRGFDEGKGWPMSATDATDVKNVLLVCGSLRKRSLNRQVGERAAAMLHEMDASLHTRWLDYADLPYMNQDAEFPTPAAVARVRAEVTASDAVWFFSPEYNHGIPGVLKNLLDWLSRPLEPGSEDTAMRGRLTLFSCAGGGAKARYCSACLEETLAFLKTDLVETMHVQVALNRQDYTTDVLTLSADEELALRTQAQLLADRLSG